MIQRILLLSFALLLSNIFYGQTMEELKAQKKEKEAQIAALQDQIKPIQAEVAALQTKIDGIPKWKKGAFGTIGLNISEYSDWLSRDKPTTSATTIGFTANAFANYEDAKSFWKNAGNLNLAWIKFDDGTQDDVGLEPSADGFNVTSLYGRKLSDKFAISVLGEYRTTILDNFNDPGYLDLGAGGTWTPIPDMVVVLHPLNYNFVFSSGDLAYESSLGAKIVADYTRQLPKGVSWKSNLSVFLSYSDTSNLSNWTWVNGLSFKIWKAIGVGFELGLRNNKQEGYNAKIAGDDTLTTDNFKIDDLDSDDNPLQTYWLLGLTYGF